MISAPGALVSSLLFAAMLAAMRAGETSAAVPDAGPDVLVPVSDSTAAREGARALFRITPRPGPDLRAEAAAGHPVTAITITGNKITKEYVILRELELAVGAPFSVEVMAADVQRLENLGIFSSVTIVPQEAAGGGVVVAISVREMPWIIPYIALRISDQTGISIGPAVSSLNLLGRDISFSGRALFGGATTYQAVVEWPWIAGDHLSFELVAGHGRRDDEVRGFEETSNEVTPWIGTYLGRHGRLRGGCSYFAVESDVDGITLSPDNRDQMVRLGAAIGLDTRDGWANPHQGWENEAQVLHTGGILGGDGDFWTVDLDVRRYQPLGRHTLLLAGLATLQSGTLGTDIPSYMDYRMGGANSIRGYETAELGKVLAGKDQLITTVEYQYLLWDISEVTVSSFAMTLGLELAAFVDTGIAWSSGGEFNADRARTGFGVGLRPLVPSIGEIRLDLGVSTGGDLVFHLATSPKVVAQRLRLR